MKARLLRGLLLLRPTSPNCLCNPRPSLWGQVPLLLFLSRTNRATKLRLGLEFTNEGTGVLQLGDFGVDLGEDVWDAHAG